MTENYFKLLTAASRDLEPGHQIRRLAAGRPLRTQVHVALEIAIAQPCEGIDDDAQTVDAAQIFVPVIGQIAVHVMEKFIHLVTTQDCLGLMRQTPGIGKVPGRKQACVNQRVSQAVVVMQQGAPTQPVQQFISVGRL